MASCNMNNNTLCVDLDGTLTHTDMLHETALKLVTSKPSLILKLPTLLKAGKATLKQEISNVTDFDPSLLPYNNELITWIKKEKEGGRNIVLCTASDQKIANKIADHLGLFDEVIASDGNSNIAGEVKASVLVDKFGEKGFDYAGNSVDDLVVWKKANKAIIVNAPDDVYQQAKLDSDIEHVFKGPEMPSKRWLKMLRVHQWLKNVLLFVPVFAAHTFTDFSNWVTLFFAFISFSLCASTVYIANDLLDLESDRQHPSKSKRPFASCAIPISQGIVIAPLLLLTSFSIAFFVGQDFVFWLAIYFFITCIYSIKLKQLVLIDCFTLALLYTMRIIAGAAAVNLEMSFWLLAFSGFLFFSLSFVKRFAELQLQLLNGKHKANGRGYFTDDAPIVQSIGVSSGYISVLVLALYLNSEDVLKLYSNPEWVYGSVVVMLFWVSWIWLRAFRGEMHDDPVVFAVKDRVSVVAGFIFALFLIIGNLG